MAAVAAHVEDGEGQRCDHENDGRPGRKPGEHVGRSARTKRCLRALAAEGACQIGRASLLDENHADEEEANDHVDDDDKVK